MNYWLIKSEGDCYSIDDLKKDKEVSWTGIRNFQARNFMRDGMKVGDLALFYHSNGDAENPTGVYGVAEVSAPAHIDKTALDPKDEHYDPKAVKYQKEGKDPMWMCVDMKFKSKFANPVTLDAIRRDSAFNSMLLVQPGQRLSVMPVAKHHFERILKMGE